MCECDYKNPIEHVPKENFTCNPSACDCKIDEYLKSSVI